MYKTFKQVHTAVAAILFIMLVSCIVLQVIARYVLQVSIPWTEEAARLLTMFTTFLGAGITSRKGEHLGAFFLRDRCKGRARAVVFIVNSLIIVAYLSLMILGCFIMYSKQYPGQPATTMSWFQMRWLYFALITGGAIMAGYAIRDLIWSIRAFITNTDTLTGNSSPFLEADDLIENDSSFLEEE